MDGVTVAAVACELNHKLYGARVEKVYQPEKDTLLLHFRGKQKLLLSANPGNARVHLTENAYQNPAEPPMFCMLLRKMLTGSRLMHVSQPGFDRVLHFEFQSQDDMGYETVYTLVAEIMGKHSNLILVRPDGGIADSIKHITPAISSVRCVIPGYPYQTPPSQGKHNPLLSTADDILNTLHKQEGTLQQLIGRNWSGISSAIAREIASCSAPESMRWENMDRFAHIRAAETIYGFFQNWKNERFHPTLIVDEYEEAIACFPLDSVQYAQANKRYFDSMSAALDRFYSMRDNQARIKQKGASLQKILHNNIERCQKKLAIQQDILLQTDKMEENKLYGELLTANLHLLKRGMKEAEVINYYDTDGLTVKIPLDERLSPSENAQRYYKRYNKASAAYAMADDQIQIIRKELNYLEGQLDNLHKCTETDELQEIREELIAQKYLRPDKPSHRRKQHKTPPTKPMHFVSGNGFDIYVGKNNAQNDRLTMRFADSDDMWLHTKDEPGSHVIIRSEGAEIPDQTINEAAHLAAYYSNARASSQVPVDYTLRKNIRKPSGSQPGFVTYSTNKTAYITPDEGLVKRLQRQSKEE